MHFYMHAKVTEFANLLHYEFVGTTTRDPASLSNRLYPAEAGKKLLSYPKGAKIATSSVFTRKYLKSRKVKQLQNNSFKKVGYSSKKSVRGSVQIRKGVVLQAVVARHVMNKCKECPVKVAPL